MRQGRAECMKRAHGDSRLAQPSISGRAQVATAIAIDQHPHFDTAPRARVPAPR